MQHLLQFLIRIFYYHEKPDITNETTIDISDLLSIVHQGGASISNVATQISDMYNTTQIIDCDYILDNVVLFVSSCKNHQVSYEGLNVLSWPWLDLVFTHSAVIEDEDQYEESDDQWAVLVVGEELI